VGLIGGAAGLPLSRLIGGGTPIDCVGFMLPDGIFRGKGRAKVESRTSSYSAINKKEDYI